MNMNIGDRILNIVNRYCGGSQVAFAKAIGVTPQYANRIVAGRGCGLRTVESILNAFPDVNARWLVCGTGVMSISEQVEGECLADSIDRITAKINSARRELAELCAKIGS